MKRNICFALTTFILTSSLGISARAQDACSSLAVKTRQARTDKMMYQESLQSLKNWEEIAKDAKGDKTLASSIALGSGAVLTLSPLFIIFSGGTAVPTYGVVGMAAVQKTLGSIELGVHVANVLGSAVPVAGLKFALAVTAVGVANADNIYILRTSFKNIFSDSGKLKDAKTKLAATRTALENAIAELQLQRTATLENSPNALLDGLTFGKLDADYTQKLYEIALLETGFKRDLMRISQAEEMVERASNGCP